jgi:hypothetical protein
MSRKENLALCVLLTHDETYQAVRSTLTRKSSANDLCRNYQSVIYTCNISCTETTTCRSSARTDLVQLECKYFRNNSRNRGEFASRSGYLKWNYGSTWNSNILYHRSLGLAHKVSITLWNVNYELHMPIEDNYFLCFAIVPGSGAALM